MSEGTLELLGPCETWHGAAHHGRLALAGSTRPVLVLLGPEGATPDAIARARLDAANALRMRGGALLALLDVAPHDGRIAWIYEHTDALGLVHVVSADEAALLSTRAAAEVVASVAEILLALGAAGFTHPGPEPTDLFVDRNGLLKLSGFVGPFPPSPSMRSPNGSTGEAAVVYRLGVLLAHLVSGVQPAPTTDRSGHGAMVRRALIRAMARPGPLLTERYGDWLRGMLAWDPGERPPLSAVPAGLRKVAEATGGAALSDWAVDHVDGLLEAVRQGHAVRASPRADVDDLPAVTEEVSAGWYGELVHGPPPRRDTQPPVARARDAFDDTGPYPATEAPPAAGPKGPEDFPEDDPTQEAASLVGEPPRAPSLPPTDGLSMPVEVGPPPEAVTRTPSLPRGFLDDTGSPVPAPTLDASSRPRRQSPYRWVLPMAWAFMMFTLVLMALVLVVYLLADPVAAPPVRPAPEGPSLSDILAGPDARNTSPRVDHSVVVEEEPVVEADVEVEPPGIAEDLGSAEDGTTDEGAPSSPTASRRRNVVGSDAVLFRAVDPHALVTVECGGEKQTHAGAVWFSGLSAEPCTVSADLGRGRLVANVVATGPGKFTCFEGNKPTCYPR